MKSQFTEDNFGKFPSFWTEERARLFLHTWKYFQKSPRIRRGVGKFQIPKGGKGNGPNPAKVQAICFHED